MAEERGVIVGSGIGGLSTIEEEHMTLKEKGARRVSPFLIPKLISNIAPGEIAIRWGFTGPNYAVSSACATSNNAIGDALRLIRYSDADIRKILGQNVLRVLREAEKVAKRLQAERGPSTAVMK